VCVKWVGAGTRLLSYAAVGTFVCCDFILLYYCYLSISVNMCRISQKLYTYIIMHQPDDTHSRIIPFNLVQSIYSHLDIHMRIQGRFTVVHHLSIIIYHSWHKKTSHVLKPFIQDTQKSLKKIVNALQKQILKC